MNITDEADGVGRRDVKERLKRMINIKKSRDFIPANYRQSSRSFNASWSV